MKPTPPLPISEAGSTSTSLLVPAASSAPYSTSWSPILTPILAILPNPKSSHLDHPSPPSFQTFNPNRHDPSLLSNLQPFIPKTYSVLPSNFFTRNVKQTELIFFSPGFQPGLQHLHILGQGCWPGRPPLTGLKLISLFTICIFACCLTEK